MVAPDPVSSKYTTINVQDGIQGAFPNFMDNTWVDPNEAASDTDDEPEKGGLPSQWEMKDLWRKAWSACDDELDDDEGSEEPAHRWAGVCLPKTKQMSRKDYSVVARGGNLPWSKGIYRSWKDCHRHT